MYSVVLMAALNTSLATPDLGRRGGGGGCCGCYGGGYGGCYGGGWGGCYGGGWGGGWGGCYGGGWGGGWGGCYGGGFGYGGGWGGGYGGCYGGMMMGGGYPVMMGGCYGGGMMMGGGVIIGGGTGGTGGTKKDGKDGKDGKGGRREGSDEESMLTPGSAEVVLIVSLPAEAKLLIDDKPTRSTGPTRVFVSPRLDSGRSYTYELKGEIQQEGRTRNVSQSVKVEPGRTTYVNLTFPTREVAQGNP